PLKKRRSYPRAYESSPRFQPIPTARQGSTFTLKSPRSNSGSLRERLTDGTWYGSIRCEDLTRTCATRRMAERPSSLATSNLLSHRSRMQPCTYDIAYVGHYTKDTVVTPA